MERHSIVNRPQSYLPRLSVHDRLERVWDMDEVIMNEDFRPRYGTKSNEDNIWYESVPVNDHGS